MATTEKDWANGLTKQEAAQRLLATGANELPSSKPASNWHIAVTVLSEPMLLLLIACGGIYLFLGDISEAMILLAFVFVIIGITFFQERQNKNAGTFDFCGGKIIFRKVSCRTNSGNSGFHGKNQQSIA